MKINKKNVIIALILIPLIYFLLRDYKVDYCNCNSYILEGRNPVIELRGNFNLSHKSKIIVKQNNKFIKSNLVGQNIELFSKVRNTDTLQVEIDKLTFKIYDFKNNGWRTKFGIDKGKFECFLQEYKIDTVQIKNAESLTICIDRFNVVGNSKFEKK